MVVDDDAQSLELIAELLRDMVEVEISAFSEPRAALRAFVAEPAAFELVITDLNMPGLDGAALTCALLAHAPELRVILCTGSCRALSPADARALGFAAVLPKPFQASALAAAVRWAFAQSRAGIALAA